MTQLMITIISVLDIICDKYTATVLNTILLSVFYLLCFYCCT